MDRRAPRHRQIHRFVLIVTIALLFSFTSPASASGGDAGDVESRFDDRHIAWTDCGKTPLGYVPDVLLGVDLSPAQKKDVAHHIGLHPDDVIDGPYDISVFELANGNALAMLPGLVANTGASLHLNHVFFFSPYHRFSPAVAPAATDGPDERQAIGTTHRPVVVIDTGYPLGATEPKGYHLGAETRGPVPLDAITSNHGPFIASQIAALTPGDITLQRVLTERGRLAPATSGEEVFDEIALLATLDETNLNNAIVNLSFGSYGCIHEGPAALRHALDVEHGSSGAVFVAAAGNDELGLEMYPAAFAGDLDAVVSVGAHNGRPLKPKYPKRACFSNFGNITTWAPGVDVLGEIPTPHGATLAQGSGTSFATPYVTAALASETAVFAPGSDIVQKDLGLFSLVADYHGRRSDVVGTACA